VGERLDSPGRVRDSALEPEPGIAGLVGQRGVPGNMGVAPRHGIARPEGRESEGRESEGRESEGC
jgi:hypothetical protein